MTQKNSALRWIDFAEFANTDYGWSKKEVDRYSNKATKYLRGFKYSILRRKDVKALFAMQPGEDQKPEVRVFRIGRLSRDTITFVKLKSKAQVMEHLGEFHWVTENPGRQGSAGAGGASVAGLGAYPESPSPSLLTGSFHPIHDSETAFLHEQSWSSNAQHMPGRRAEENSVMMLLCGGLARVSCYSRHEQFPGQRNYGRAGYSHRFDLNAPTELTRQLLVSSCDSARLLAPAVRRTLHQQQPTWELSTGACELHCELLAILMHNLVTACDSYLYQARYGGGGTEVNTESKGIPVRDVRNAVLLCLPRELAMRVVNEARLAATRNTAGDSDAI